MQIVKATPKQAPIILVHAAEGRGKTTLALKSSASPLAFLFERGLPRGTTVDEVGDIGTFEKFMAALKEFYTNPSGYQSLIIDTIDALEPILIEDVCAKNGWKNIEAPSYGKGWTAADDAWRRYIRAISAIRDKHNVTIFQTCHTAIERVDDPRAPTYTSYQPRLHRRARALVMDAADAVFFLAEDIRVVTESGGFNDRTRASSAPGRFLFCEGKPAFAAKNRFGMPEKMPIALDFDFSHLSQYWLQ